MKKARILSLIFICALLWLTAAHAAAATRYSDGVYTFEKTQYNNAVVTDCALTDDTVEVPQFILGYPVVGIGNSAFMDKSALQTVTIPISVISIGEFAFANDPLLHAVTIPRYCETIADNAFFNSPNVTIYCDADTAAHLYAQRLGIPFVLHDVPAPKKDIALAQMTLETVYAVYDGTAKEPAVTVYDGEKLLEEGTDYTVTYGDNTAPGEATVTVAGIGDYMGGRLLRFYVRNMRGDPDGDGMVTILDATAIQRRLASFSVSDPERVDTLGDIDGDGLNILDATHIQRWLVGYETESAIGQMTDK